MELWLLVAFVSVLFSVPVLLLSYYWLFLLGNSFRYPKQLGRDDLQPKLFPLVSILIAAYNEEFVIGRTLDAIKELEYPPSKLQVVVADDSTDGTMAVVDRKVSELRRAGIRSLVSRRMDRENFKQGALNKAMNLVDGEYVLLLDADSTVTPKVLTKGLVALESHSDAAFVSFRVGHYNRNQNLITRVYALSLDMGDMVTKMGSYIVNAPFSFQGGFTLVSVADLRQVGLWTTDRMADDADISIKLYLAGKRGVYLSNVRVMSEDPPTLEAWKKQAARTAQGWSRCVSRYWNIILGCSSVSVKRRLALLLMMIAPFSSLSWMIVNFMSALSVILGLVPPGNSIFNDPLYAFAISIPVVLFFVSAAYSLKVQELLNLKNAFLIPVLSYTLGCTIILGSIGFIYGIFGTTGFFRYRTPKLGSDQTGPAKNRYFSNLSNDRTALIEAVLSIAGIVLAFLIAEKGVWLLCFSLAAFGILTLKSMNITRFLRIKGAPIASLSRPFVATTRVRVQD